MADSKNVIFYLKLESKLSSQSKNEYFWLDKNRSPLSCISDDSQLVSNILKILNLENSTLELYIYFFHLNLTHKIYSRESMWNKRLIFPLCNLPLQNSFNIFKILEVLKSLIRRVEGFFNKWHFWSDFLNIFYQNFYIARLEGFSFSLSLRIQCAETWLFLKKLVKSFLVKVN